MAAILSLHFNEPVGVQPSDALGNAGDFAVGAGLVAATPVKAWSGAGHQFAANTGYVSAGDISYAGTAAPRDCTIQAIVCLIDPVYPMTLIARGTNNGGAGDFVNWGLRLVDASGPALQQYWHDTAGVVHNDPPVLLPRPPVNGEFLLLTATRRWEAVDRVVTRYYVADDLLAEQVTTVGNIGGGTTGLVTVGARRNAGVWSEHLRGVIDDINVYDHEASLAEVRHTWLTLTKYLPAGRIAIAGHTPPGLDLDAPHKLTHKWITLAGQAAGMLHAYNEEIRSRWFPGDCDAAQLAEWERVLALVPRPGDTLVRRAERAKARLAMRRELTRANVASLLAETLSAEADDLDIVEFGQARHEPWDLVNAQRWHATAGSWSPLLGNADGVATGEHRWTYRAPAFLGTALTGNSQRVNVTGSVSATSLASGAFAGLALINRVTWTGFALGVRQGATKRIVALQLTPTSVTVIDLGAAGVDTVYLRLRYAWDGYALVGSHPIEVGWTTDMGDAAANAYATQVVNASADPQWFGPILLAENPGGTDSATFGPLTWEEAAGTDPFHWYVYRSPILLGVPDLEGGERLVQKLAPANSDGHAVASLALLCDTDGLDRVPLGALDRKPAIVVGGGGF